MQYLETFRRGIILLVAASLIIVAGLLSFITLSHMAESGTETARSTILRAARENAGTIDAQFASVEQSTTILHSYLEYGLQQFDESDTSMDEILDRLNMISIGVANNIEAVSVVYVRMDSPTLGEAIGFLMVEGDNGYERVTLTDISSFSEDDVEHVGWYYIPLKLGRPVWLPPYQNKNLGIYMISYVIPFTYGDIIGVIGMDVDLNRMNGMVNRENIYKDSYAYLTVPGEAPLYNAIDRTDDPKWTTYHYPLRNGMTVSVTAPNREITRTQREVLHDIIFTTFAVLIDAIGIAVLLALRMHSTLQTALDAANQAQQEAVDAANRSNQAKAEFLSRMSHDIRTPINGITGMVELLRRNRKNDAKVDDCVDKIDMSAGHLLSLVNDILDVQRLENGKMVFPIEPFNLTTLMADCVDMVSGQAAKEGICLTGEWNGIEHPHLIGSPLRVRQVFLNLLTNAIKYNKPHGSVSITAEELEFDDTHASFRFVCADTGIGMNEDFVSHAFERFAQEHDDERSVYKGAGLGLFITKAITEEMKGTIAVKSREGEGSTFTVLFTFRLDSEPQEPADRTMAGSAPDADCSGMTVLLVEDNDLNFEIAKELLEDAGVTVHGARNGREAVDAFEKAPAGTYDLILMDVMMPVLGGLGATREIRAMERAEAQTIPILAMTANALQEDIVKCKAAGMNEHLAKPLDIDHVLSVMAHYRKIRGGVAGATTGADIALGAAARAEGGN